MCLLVECHVELSEIFNSYFDMTDVRLVFDTDTAGHHVEYIHHIYMKILEKTDHSYIIVVPEDFKLRESQYIWPKVNNIVFEYIPQDVVDKANSSSIYVSSFRRTKLLLHYVRKFSATHVLLITLIKFIPFLPFAISKKINIYGIIYKLYLYEWNDYSVIRKFFEIFKYKVMSYDNCIKKIFILNDSSSAARLNALYHVDKFLFLADPFNADNYKPINIRSRLEIPADNSVFLHAGAMNRRKGTLMLLNSILHIPQHQRRNMTFVIAGAIQEDIKEEFERLFNIVKDKCQIVLFNEYCSKSFMADLFESCDCIVLPYEVTAQSSGLIGYAAHYRKPVIGPNTGLVGKLIRKYRLGIHLKEITPESLAITISNFKPYLLNTDYCSYATIGKFQNQICSYF